MTKEEELAPPKPVATKEAPTKAAPPKTAATKMTVAESTNTTKKVVVEEEGKKPSRKDGKKEAPETDKENCHPGFEGGCENEAECIEGACRCKPGFTGPSCAEKEKTSPKLDYAKALAEVVKRREAILKYYHGDKKLLDAIFDKDRASEKMLTARLVQRVLLAQKATAGGKKPRFVVGSVGSSVTAGHDGFFETAYTNVLKRQLGPMLEAAGVELVVRNAAVGGTAPWPPSLCLANQVGGDVDLITREWEYWTLDNGVVGRGIEKGGQDSVVAAFETFVRNAMRLPSKPVVYMLDMAQATAAGTLPASNAIMQQHIVPSAGLLKAYNGMPLNAFSHFGRPFDHLRSNTEGRFLKEDPNTACSPDLFNDVARCQVVKDKQDGYHLTSQWPPSGHKLRNHEEAHPGVFHTLFANWHPGLLGHEVMGMQLAYHLASLLEKSLSGLLEASRQAKGGKLSKQYLADVAAMATSPPMPSNVACASSWCNYDLHCAYEDEPRFARPSIQDWRVDEDGKPLTEAAKQATWKLESGLMQPPRTTPEDAEAACKADNWKGEQCFNQLKLGSYRDRKVAVTGRKKDGMLRLRLRAQLMMQCRIWIDELKVGWNKPLMSANLKEDLRITLNGKECGEACKVYEQDGQQSIIIDARQALGSACRRKDTILGIEVLPAGGTKKYTVPPCVMNNGKCMPRGQWADVEEALCSDPKDCSKVLDRPEEEVRTNIVDVVIS